MPSRHSRPCDFGPVRHGTGWEGGEESLDADAVIDTTRRPCYGPSMSDGRWPNWRVVLALGLGIFLYFRSPIDLLPDRMGLLGLVDDLAVLVVGLMWLSRRLGETRTASSSAGIPPGDRAPDAVPTDPYEILEVAFDASQDEITRAYREQMKRYHPDRVATLGAELQRLAHERTIAIQRAYDAIGRR